MFEICVDPEKLSGLSWLSCYITTPKHLNLFYSVGTVLLLLLLTAPTALLFGFIGAVMARSKILVIKVIGNSYISIVRGVPDIAFFLFFVIALDQLFEWVRHKFLCPEWNEPIRQGNDFVVCTIAKLPLNSSPQWIHEIYGFLLAVFTFAIVFGAFAANVLYGAMRAVPKTQIETAVSFGMTDRQVFHRILIPQMWIFALPGLGNLWMILIKATPLLFLLGVEDIVYWARELGGTKTAKFTSYPHGDWRVWYFLGLLVFYLAFTRISEAVIDTLMKSLSHGTATLGGDLQGQVGR
jgi:polar amino acid transport system permease protein